MPGYEVKGFVSKEWLNDDALHCRTLAVFDPKMISISHPRKPEMVRFKKDGFPVIVTIENRSESELSESETVLFHRSSGSREWKKSPLVSTDVNDQYTALIPSYLPGTNVEYYIQATNENGHSECLPPPAPKTVYRFTVQQKEAPKI